MHKDTELKSGEKYYKVDVIASMFGLTVRRVQQLTQEGIIVTVQTTEGRRYELETTIQKYIKYLSDKAHGKSKSEREIELREQKLEADIALKESQGELHRIKTEIAAGKYIDIEEVKMDYSRFFIIFKKFTLSIPSRIAGRISGQVDPLEVRAIEKDLSSEIKKMLNNFIVSGVVGLKAKNEKSTDEKV